MPCFERVEWQHFVYITLILHLDPAIVPCLSQHTKSSCQPTDGAKVNGKLVLYFITNTKGTKNNFHDNISFIKVASEYKCSTSNVFFVTMFPFCGNF